MNKVRAMIKEGTFFSRERHPPSLHPTSPPPHFLRAPPWTDRVCSLHSPVSAPLMRSTMPAPRGNNLPRKPSRAVPITTGFDARPYLAGEAMEGRSPLLYFEHAGKYEVHQPRPSYLPSALTLKTLDPKLPSEPADSPE